MGGGNSRLTPEQRKEHKRYEAMKKGAYEIKDKEYEWMICYDDNGKELFRTTDNNKHEVGPGDHEDEVYNTRMVHNHPSGGCFSDADVSVASRMKEIWAVTSNLIQIFKWNTNYYMPGYKQAEGKMIEFYNKLSNAYKNNHFINNAKVEYEKKHPMPDIVGMKFSDYTKLINERAREITLLAHKKEREFFKNHQKDYGYTYTERSY